MPERPTRERIIDTTAQLLQRQGYHGTGLNQILDDAKAPKGSMYFHFPGGKEQLAAEAITRAGDYLDTALAAHRRDSAEGSLDAYLADVAKLLEATNYTDGCPIATVSLEVAPTIPHLADACQHAYAQLLDRIRGWLEEDGFTTDDADERAFLIYAAIEGALVFAKAQRSSQPIERLRAQLPSLLRRPSNRRARI